MAKRNKYIRTYLRWRKGYEKRALKELRKVFREYGRSIDLTGVKPVQLEAYLNETLDIDLLWKAYIKIYTQIGSVHRARVLKGFKAEKKGVVHASLSGFEKYVVKYLMKFAGNRIVSVHQSYIQTIKDLIVKEIAKEWTLYDTTQSILELITDPTGIIKKPDFYKWQSQRIARTETTASSNWAALQAADDTGFVMEKEWISLGKWTNDGRTREHEDGDYFDHVDMNHKKVPRYAKFEMESMDPKNPKPDLMDFPGDPSGSAANVINCRCTVALVAKRDENGNLIPTF